MTFEPLPLTVLVRTRSRVATPLTRLLTALGIATEPTTGNLTVCVYDEGDTPAPEAGALVVLAASDEGFARARRTVGARNPTLDHPGQGLMPPEGHIATVTAEAATSAALLQALALAAGDRPGPARIDVEHLALHIIMPVVSALSVGVMRSPVRPPSRITYPLGIVPCADGEVGAYQAVPTEWPRFCAMIGREDIVEAYPTVESRRESGADIWEAAAPWFRARPVDEVVRIAQDAGLPYAAVLPIDALPASPYLHRRGAIATDPDGELAPGAPWRVEHAPTDGELHPRREALREALATALPPPVAGPLSGLVVVEVTQHWAGPLAARLLADYGAHVIKCEPVGGDFWRVTGNLRDENISWTFEPINLGKGSMTMDLRDPTDRALLEALLGACDIRIENLSQGARDRAGLALPGVAARNPNVIALSLPGYETAGPLAALRGMGWSFEVASGYASALGGGKAANSGYPYGDPIGAITAFLAVLRELARRRLGGGGGAALLDIGQVAALSYTLVETLRTGESGPALTTLDDAIAGGRPDPSWPLDRIVTASGRPMDHPGRLVPLADQPPRNRAPALDEHGDAVREAVAKALGEPGT
ncbi:MAG: CoA transferase [Chloroflexi bacterium]|nr:CoA transferase [Chloroflexota bacterium]